MGKGGKKGAIISIEALEIICPSWLIEKIKQQAYYTELQDLLTAGKWKEANDTTHSLMNRLTGNKGHISPYDMRNFPQKDLDKIDRLWAEKSEEKFGFKIQAKIYRDSVGTDKDNIEETWKNFNKLIGWRKDGKWLGYSDLIFSKEDACEAHLPWPPYIERNAIREYFDALSFRYTEIPLNSARGIDYTQLRNYLTQGKWKEADQETTNVMLQVANRNHQGEWLRVKDVNNFPCEDLQTINQLWLHYSDGKFGFSVQAKSYLNLGSTEEYDEEIWWKFGNAVGWQVNNKWSSYADLLFDLSVPKGHLPCGIFVVFFGGWWEWGLISSLTQRLVNCKILRKAK